MNCRACGKDIKAFDLQALLLCLCGPKCAETIPEIDEEEVRYMVMAFERLNDKWNELKVGYKWLVGL